MPFWWRRRRRPWFGTWRKRRYTFRQKKRRRRFPRRYKRRRTTRRRRRRRKKVRRKKQTIPVRQWQPDSITKCKIKGFGCIVAGAEGSQMYCYTDQREKYPQPKAPGGGGFGCEVYSLQYLYQQWKAHRNIWTKSNDYKDLCRFTGAKIRIFRHPTTDFVFRYHRQPPFDIKKDTYTSIHPLNMLLSKHHRVILSRKSKPTGKQSVVVKIKPPKQMITKWFFQEEFTKFDLLQLDCSAANMEYAIYGPNTQNSNLTMFALNTKFYQIHSWQKDIGDNPYLPYAQYPRTKPVTYTYPGARGDQDYQLTLSTYYPSINWETGLFNWRVLQAKSVKWDSTPHHERPVTIVRYNPDKDTGEKNVVYVVSITSNSSWRIPDDKDLSIAGLPLWMAIFGFWDYILHVKGTDDFFKYHMFVVKSPAIELITATQQDTFPLIDLTFLKGQMPYGETLTDNYKKLWYPTAYQQVQTLNNIVKCGPYIPKYDNLPSSTWNLMYHYTFYFKWGGPEMDDQPVQNPEDQGKYPVPDHLTQTVQVSNPLRQQYKAMLRAWDYRRGIVTSTALKRMSEHLELNSTLESDDTEPAKKKKKITAQIRNPEEENKEIQTCLQSLFEESTFQETPQETDMLHLIQQQQQQQQKLKYNIIQLLTELKTKQTLKKN
nr:MAG: ORF1 [Torque teno midi virus]